MVLWCVIHTLGMYTVMHVCPGIPRYLFVSFLGIPVVIVDKEFFYGLMLTGIDDDGI